MDAIVGELVGLTFIGVSDGYLVLTMVVGALISCPVHPDSSTGSLVCGFGGGRVLLLGSA